MCGMSSPVAASLGLLSKLQSREIGTNRASSGPPGPPFIHMKMQRSTPFSGYDAEGKKGNGTETTVCLVGPEDPLATSHPTARPPYINTTHRAAHRHMQSNALWGKEGPYTMYHLWRLPRPSRGGGYVGPPLSSQGPCRVLVSRFLFRWYPLVTLGPYPI